MAPSLSFNAYCRRLSFALQSYIVFFVCANFLRDIFIYYFKYLILRSIMREGRFGSIFAGLSNMPVLKTGRNTDGSARKVILGIFLYLCRI